MPGVGDDPEFGSAGMSALPPPKEWLEETVTELTPEERERIFQEEKARHEAREQLDKAARQKNIMAAKRRQQRTTIGCLVATAVVAIAFVLISLAGSRSEHPSVDVGEQGRIASGAERVIAGVDVAAFDQVVKSQQAHDEAGVTALILSGRAFFVEEGTRVLVIDRSTTLRKVRTLEGPAVGRAGWVPAEWVKK
jgi:hypothetical protein